MILILGESVIIFLTVTLTFLVLTNEKSEIEKVLKEVWPRILLVVVITQLCLYLSDLYEGHLLRNSRELVAKVLRAIGVTLITLAFIYFVAPATIIGRWTFLWSTVLLAVFVISWRFLYSFIFQKTCFKKKTMIVGDGELANDIIQELERDNQSSDEIGVIITKGENKQNHGPRKRLQLRTGFEELYNLVKEEKISQIIVALDQKRGVMPYKELLRCKMQGIKIIDGETFYENASGKILVERINPSWLIFSDGFEKTETAKTVKRLVGLTFASLMLLFLSPLMALIAAAIKIDSPGRIMFSQERVGENGRMFTLHKFRSMCADAEKTCGPVWADECDPRITRVGKIIRKLRLDELPQLWDVIKGDMSFVGPRPERPYFVEKLMKAIPYYSERLTVKPGITGWAQIKYPYGASEKEALEKLKYDLYYIKNMSLLMDLTIIFHTVKIVLLGRGAR